MSASLQHTYAYRSPSAVHPGKISLASSPGPGEIAEPFVRARLVEPRRVATSLRLVSDIVRSRHHIPAAMLERILIEADPVLTWGTDVLRVEGFSSCCGIYVRVDVSQDALDPDELRPGTTNVDFNAEMRAALGGLRDTDQCMLEIGDVGVGLAHDSRGVTEAVFERKVKLPLRWLRGFAEVQAVQARMEPRLELDRTRAVRFLRSLPRSGRSSDAAWVIASGRSVRLGSSHRDGAVRVAGMSRLRMLEPALTLLEQLVVHEDPVTGASCWRAEGKQVALTMVLSPETWRGFSGEGQLLSNLAAKEEDLSELRASLCWQSEIQAGDAAALARLATRGLVGFDVGRGAWFHRVLPFDLDKVQQWVEAQNPRLRHAVKLSEAGAVTIESDRDQETEATVRSGDVKHRVRFRPDGPRCTCPWYAKHRGERGPCKHVLAVELHLAKERPR